MFKIFVSLLIFFIQFISFAQEPPIKISHLIGRTRNTVLDSLRKKNIRFEIINQESDEDSGKVIGLEPSNNNNLASVNLVRVIVAVPKEIEMPNLVNLSIQDAERIISRYKLVLRTVSERESDSEPNKVLDQDPKAGVKVKTLTPVDLIISKQMQTHEMVEVPYLIDLSLNDAIALLNQRGLRIGDVEKEESDKEPNIVINQSPEADKKVEIGSSVNVVISIQPENPQTTEVPDLINRPIEEALNLLSQSGLRLGELRELENDREPGIVIGQVPIAYTKVEIGSQVDIVISKEIIPAELPKIIQSVSSPNPEPDQDVSFDIIVIPKTENLEFLFNYGDRQTSEWTRFTSINHSYKKEGIYEAFALARIRGRILPESNHIIIKVSSPVNWAEIIIGGVAVLSISLFSYSRVLKRKKIKKILNERIQLNPRKQIGRQSIQIDSNEFPSFSIKIRPVADEGKQWIEML